MTTPDAIRRFAVLGNHLPRHCGIATFSTHLTDALSAAQPGVDGFVVAMNDAGRRHAYPPRVRFEIGESDLGGYARAADFINASQVDVLSVQHEYGIFGGKAGEHLLPLLRRLQMPIVTTLHTILSAPSAAQRHVIDELARLSERLVVMSESGAELLRRVHDIPSSQIDLIPHGIPDVPRGTGSKERLGLDGRTVMMTFGLLSPDKGIEYVIDALPAILAVHPETVYVILGATHPHVVEREGEAYRLMLEARGQQLGVDGHIIFHDRFVSQDELTEFLAATDIYITPYLQPEQITSGTLAYAVGNGKAAISTPYIYAKELLSGGRGLLVPWRDADAIAHQVITLLSDDDARAAMCARAAAYGVGMTWPAVARLYVESFARARTHARKRRASFEAQTLASRTAGLPEIDLRHLRALTDDTGLLQHAAYSIPRYGDGYCLDDNARALLLMTTLDDAGSADPMFVRGLASRYLAFVTHAFDRPSGRFRNFLSYGRQWLEPVGSEDSHGRALWALGTVVGRGQEPGRQSLAADLFLAALPAVAAFNSPRAWAYTLLAINEFMRAGKSEGGVDSIRVLLADRLLAMLQKTRGDGWIWFEDALTYCNARLPHALIVTGEALGRRDVIEAGMQSLKWLVDLQLSPEGQFAPIGSNGFYQRNGPRAAFDQQPVEACATVSACLDACRVGADDAWCDHARRAFQWFIGQNQLRLWLYDTSTGGCRDGLHSDRANQNQGAEATLSFLMALCDMRVYDQAEKQLLPEPIEHTTA